MTWQDELLEAIHHQPTHIAGFPRSVAPQAGAPTDGMRLYGVRCLHPDRPMCGGCPGIPLGNHSLDLTSDVCRQFERVLCEYRGGEWRAVEIG